MPGTPTIQAIRSYGSGLAARRKISITDKIFTIEPYDNPATLILSKLPKKKVGNMKHSWLYDEYAPVWDNVNEAMDTTETAMTVDHYTYFVAGDLVAPVVNGKIVEIMMVTDASSANLTVIRNWAYALGGTAGDQTTGVAFADNTPLLILGTAYNEQASVTAARTVKETEIPNYLQNFIEFIKWTEIQEHLDLYGGKDRAYQQNKKMKEFMRQLERSFFFGYPIADTTQSSTYSNWATGGAYHFINTYASGNILSVNGTLTKRDFYDWLRTAFKYGSSSTRFLYASPLIASALSWWEMDKIRFTPNDKLAGLAIGKWNSPVGLVNVVIHKIFEDPATAVGTAFGGMAFFLDMADITYLHLGDKDVHMELDIVQDGSELHVDKINGTIGFEFNTPWNHGVLENVTDFS